MPWMCPGDASRGAHLDRLSRLTFVGGIRVLQCRIAASLRIVAASGVSSRSTALTALNTLILLIPCRRAVSSAVRLRIK